MVTTSRLALLTLVTAALGIAAYAGASRASTIIVSDGFSGTNGSDINGRTPDGANLPGSAWQVEQQNASGASPMTIDTSAGNPAPAVNTNFNDGAGISIASANGYVEPADLTISASVEVNNSNSVGVGFYNSLPAQGSGAYNNFVGVQWNGDQHLFLENGSSNTDLGFFGSLSMTTFYTLSYSVNTATGSISSLTFDGQSVATPATTIFAGSATNLAGFYSTSSAVSDNGYIDNFNLSSPDNVAVPEPATLGLFALGAVGLLLVTRKRKVGT